MAQADSDQNGKIQLNEFIAMVSKLISGGERTALGLVAEYRKWSEFFETSITGIPKLPPVKVPFEPSAPTREEFWSVVEQHFVSECKTSPAKWGVAMDWADSVFRARDYNKAAGLMSDTFRTQCFESSIEKAAVWCKGISDGVGQGLAATAVGTGQNGGCAILLVGTRSRGLFVLWPSESEVCGAMAYGDPGSAVMSSADPQGNPIEVHAQKDASSVDGMPLNLEEWGSQLVERLVAKDFAWIYGYFSEGFWKGGPGEFQKFMDYVGRVQSAEAEYDPSAYKITLTCTVPGLCVVAKKQLEFYYCNSHVTGFFYRAEGSTVEETPEAKNPPQGYGIYLSENATTNHGKLHCDLQEGQEAVFCWTRPPGSWVQYDYTIPNTFKSSNGDECVELPHCGAPSTALQPGDIAGSAMKATGPCHVECEYAYTQRPRQTEVRDPSRPAGFYLPVPPPPTLTGSGRNGGVPGSGETLSHVEDIGDASVWEAWLNDGGLDRHDTEEESDLYFAYRTLSHMAKTLSYAADPVTMSSKRGDLSTIVDWSKTDCGGQEL